MAPIQFGVIMIPFQVMDVAGPMDILSNSSRAYLREMGAGDLADRGIEIEFHYIGETLEPVELSGNFTAVPSTTVSTCPKLDYLLIGGPKPDYAQNVPPAIAGFLRERAAEVKLLFTTCTGGIVAAAVGLLDGVNATTNHETLELAKAWSPNVKWTKETNWVIDGKFWTAGGACAGMDMIAHWVIENYGREAAEFGFATLAFEPRDVNGKLVPLSRHAGD